MDTLFAAVDISNLTTNVTTILVGFVAVGLIFLGYRYLRRVFNAA
ncbi:MAG: hypothetical protein OEV64_04930 [Desulfobulbaceae bacterium]|nr:hypothetical protein [Desulfobulbaceae bacterium]